MQKINFQNLPNKTTPINASNLNQLQTNVETAINQNEPIGAVKMYAGANAPNGYFICDGSAISRREYADLFNVIGTTYGSGNGSTTFNIPDLKGRVAVGAGNFGDNVHFFTLGDIGGEFEHTLTVDEMPSHSHNLAMANAGNDRVEEAGYSSGVNQNQATDKAIKSAGGSQPHNNLQPFIVLNYIIKY